MIKYPDGITGNAIVITNGWFTNIHGKTAHGLIRGTERFKIKGIIDKKSKGRDAGELLDGIHRNIPIYASVKEYMDNNADKPDYCIIGIAMPGGILPADFKDVILEAIHYKISVINGMHHFLNDDLQLLDAAKAKGVRLIDIRKPKPKNELKFWSGKILQLKTTRIAILGIDCASGKRTTARCLLETFRNNGIKTELIYTGQTGWFQGYPYGFILDATPNDFVSGELERAILDCDTNLSPDLILVQGQSSLSNPSGPCGQEILLSAAIKGVIFQHTPFRVYYEALEDLKYKLPDLDDELNLIRRYGAETLAITLNPEGADKMKTREYAKKLSGKLKIPVVNPLDEGAEALIPLIRKFIQSKKQIVD